MAFEMALEGKPWHAPGLQARAAGTWRAVANAWGGVARRGRGRNWACVLAGLLAPSRHSVPKAKLLQY